MKKILIIKHGSLGDIISATSVIKPIKDHFEESYITILTSPNYINFFKKLNFSHTIIADNRKGLLNFFKIIFNIFSFKFDLIIDLQNSNRTFFYCIFIKCFSSTKINGTNFLSDYRFKYNKKDPPDVIEGLGKQVSILGIKPLQKPHLNWLKDKNFKINELNNKKFFLINPGCSIKNHVKMWSSKKFSEVCSYLITKNIVPVVIGAGDDKQTINEIEKNEKKILNLYNKSSLEVIYNLSIKAEGALSNDTGPAHLIAATNCKIHLVLSSFSNIKTVIPKSQNVTFTQSNLIDNITSKEVINKIELLLKNEN